VAGRERTIGPNETSPPTCWTIGPSDKHLIPDALQDWLFLGFEDFGSRSVRRRLRPRRFAEHFPLGFLDFELLWRSRFVHSFMRFRTSPALAVCWQVCGFRASCGRRFLDIPCSRHLALVLSRKELNSTHNSFCFESLLLLHRCPAWCVRVVLAGALISWCAR